MKPHRRELLDHTDVCLRVRREASRAEGAAARERHREEELVGEEFANWRGAGEVVADLLDHAIGDLLHAHAPFRRSR